MGWTPPSSDKVVAGGWTPPEADVIVDESTSPLGPTNSQGSTSTAPVVSTNFGLDQYKQANNIPDENDLPEAQLFRQQAERIQDDHAKNTLNGTQPTQPESKGVAPETPGTPEDSFAGAQPITVDQTPQLPPKNLSQGEIDVQSLPLDTKPTEAAASPERQNQNIQEGLSKLKVNPQDDNAIYQLGYGNYESGNKDAAQNLFLQALEINPGNTSALQGLGSIANDNDDHQEALKYYQQSQAIDPNNINAAYGTAFSQLKLGNPLAAKDMNDKILSADPNNVNSLFLKSYMQEQDGNHDEAIKTLQQAQDQKVLQSPAPDFVSQAAKDYAKYGSAWDVQNNDPLGIYALTHVPVETIAEAGKNLFEGVQKMEYPSLDKNGKVNTGEQFQGLMQSLAGGAQLYFGAQMSTPGGLAFINVFNAADKNITHGYASKVLMAPLESFLPKSNNPTVEYSKQLGDAVMSLLTLHLVTGGGKAIADKTLGKVDYSEKEFKDAVDAYKSGGDLTGKQVQILGKTIQQEATPENLSALRNAAGKIPSDISGEKASQISPLIVKKEQINQQQQELEQKKTDLEIQKGELDDNFHPGIDKKVSTVKGQSTKLNTKTDEINSQIQEIMKSEVPEETPTVENKPQSILGSEDIPEVNAVPIVDTKDFVGYKPDKLNTGETIYYSFNGKDYSKGEVVGNPSKSKPNVYTVKNENGVPSVIIYGGERTNVSLKVPKDIADLSKEQKGVGDEGAKPVEPSSPEIQKLEQKRDEEITAAAKPQVDLNFIKDEKLLKKKIMDEVVDEEGNTAFREITAGKKQAQIKKNMEKLKRLIDCLHA